MPPFRQAQEIRLAVEIDNAATGSPRPDRRVDSGWQFVDSSCFQDYEGLTDRGGRRSDLLQRQRGVRGVGIPQYRNELFPGNEVSRSCSRFAVMSLPGSKAR
jgi:hypothetical protein